MRVLLIEDDRKLAEFITRGLMEAGFEVDHAASGPEGLTSILETLYDVCVCDIMLPGMNGLVLVESLRKKKVTLPILILSAKDSVETRVRGLEVGADDYLVKPFSFTELLARIHALLRRSQGYGESSKLQVADLSLDLLSRQVSRGGVAVDLQNREFELLAFLMRNAGRVVSKTMIIENVWNFNFDPHTNIVEARMSKLREKVDKSFDNKLIHTIRGAGYVLREEG